jgi:ATP-dependent Clp protease ATP-binding subunit ClpC
MEYKFELQGDFNDVIKSAKKLFENKSSLRLAGVVYSIFNHYINGIDIKPKEEILYRNIMSAPVQSRLKLMSFLTDALDHALQTTDPKTESFGVTGLPFGQDLMGVIMEIMDDDTENPGITCTRFLHYYLYNGKNYTKGDTIDIDSLPISFIGKEILKLLPNILDTFITIFPHNNSNINVEEKRLPSPQEIIDELLKNRKENNNPDDTEDDPKKKFLDMIGNILNDVSNNGTPPSPFGNLGEGISDEDFEKYGDSGPVSGRPVDPESSTPILDQFSFDMTLAARTGKYDPVVGRDSIINSMIEDMCKRKKPNVILLGEAGVGKTAVVELLAQRIANEQVPEPLLNKRICSLNLNDLVAGTKYRGEFEERLQSIIKEVIAEPNIIVYIDEFHNLVGNGGEKGNGDAAQILKPYLARGEFKCIGATTNTEYRKFIEKDAALKRRFTEIYVTEPTPQETVEILKAIVSKYEEFHHVRCPRKILELCVELAGRYIYDKNFPDKAIDVLDKACSNRKLTHVIPVDPKEQELIEKVGELREKKISFVMEQQDFVEGEKVREDEKQAQDELTKIQKKREKAKAKKSNWPEVTMDTLASTVSALSKVPIDKIKQTDNEMLGGMKKTLESRVIGQDKAIEVIVKAIQRNYLGLRDPKKPILSALFVGPSGVGKTLICQEVARIFFGSEKSLIRIDMNNYKTEMDVTRLIGASAGYIGYDDEPILMKVKRQPRSVVLLDEIEKAHTSIYDIFMDILDEGKCTLADGTVVDFTNSIIIFTGNIGTKELKEKAPSVGFGGIQINRKKENEEVVKKAIEKEFRPEFVNRIGSIVVFNELEKPELIKIFGIEFLEIQKKLGKKYKVKVSDAIRDYIIEQCNPIYGARDLKRGIEKYIVDSISAEMLENPTATKFKVDLDADKKVVVEIL